MYLDTALFKCIVRNAPLISIDLIIEDDNNSFLLGRRNNRPARGFWFVPGGRILKNESLDDAFLRITSSELGISFDRNSAHFMGVYEHFYDDNFSEEMFSTHYVVLAFKLITLKQFIPSNHEQHNEYLWIKKDDILTSEFVHHNTKAYF
ncbi:MULTISPECIES: GDP-mannose mannosyl hydrolase [Raoultella]|jgi:colanic acid biosynthesis protein WcaH|uniref:GDP-mannose mannosyl hydrolase n=1 Tax=Raoultella TaxID=160674 RepID=UPI0005178C03|nr:MULTISPECIES: GDP-mannose mannosyl hydrolase [Raoultella]EKR9385145.1 GDP-mannose mannosyl hydrolase [Raoultella ornithinolytica]MEB6436270.1 GDP-mannose mannosyl hydrolase [Raoultella ornithinolytica]HDX8327809.1 GDP-mannose mannosyl hydrolase [Raoultella ornithinolytica CD1_MRS_4]